MNKIDLKQIQNSVKIGDNCYSSDPNLVEDSIFYDNGEAVGFYIRALPEKMQAYANIANAELLSDRVPKQEMSRGPQGSKKDKLERARAGVNLVTQYSAILGSVPPNPHMRRNYPTRSSVHRVQSAKNCGAKKMKWWQWLCMQDELVLEPSAVNPGTIAEHAPLPYKNNKFVKAMFRLCSESESLIQQICPDLYERQENAVLENVPPEWRFSKLFTSSISNFNIAAQYHRDTANLKGCVNVIITKRKNCNGGNLNVPDYDLTVDSCDNSILVYPAWKNIHGVTPIDPLSRDGYRNSLIFYALKSFSGR
jgi:hypothetical protein